MSEPAAQAHLAEAIRLGGSIEEAAAILAHSLQAVLEELDRARGSISHGYVRAKAQKG